MTNRNKIDLGIVAMAIITLGILTSSCKEVTVPQRINEKTMELEAKASNTLVNETIQDEDCTIKVMDSCEWIEVDEGFAEYYHYQLVHRPRCIFCKERNNK
jgi:hypothetical protein